MAGLLVFCATPIGNMQDITLRALEALKSADAVACEDTRHTGRLLSHFGIQARLIPCHEHNEVQAAGEILARVEAGETVVMVSDAGFPGFSDPGGTLARMARERQVPFTVLPGANAALCALLLSGMDMRRFVYEGFLPVKNKDKEEALARLQTEARTTVLYEAPHRLLKTLAALAPVLGARRIAFAREITKLYEECLVMPAKEALQYYNTHPPRGEFVLVIEGAPETAADPYALLAALLAGGNPAKEAVKEAARATGMPRNQLYKHYLAQQGFDKET